MRPLQAWLSFCPCLYLCLILLPPVSVTLLFSSVPGSLGSLLPSPPTLCLVTTTFLSPGSLQGLWCRASPCILSGGWSDSFGRLLLRQQCLLLQDALADPEPLLLPELSGTTVHPEFTQAPSLLLGTQHLHQPWGGSYRPTGAQPVADLKLQHLIINMDQYKPVQASVCSGLHLKT